MNAKKIKTSIKTNEMLFMDISTPQAFVAWVLCSSDYTAQQSNIQIIPATDNTKKPRQKHDEYLMSCIEKARVPINGKFRNLTHIIVNIGPGSFTGLRISLALAKGLQAGLKSCDIIGIEALSFWQQYHMQYNNTYPLLTVLDARSNRFYTTLTLSSEQQAIVYDKNANDILAILENQISPNMPVEVNGFAGSMFCNQMSLLNPPFIFNLVETPSIQALAEYFIVLGLQYCKTGRGILQNDAQPLYIRSPV